MKSKKKDDKATVNGAQMETMDTALNKAAHGGNLEEVERLLGLGANAKFVDAQEGNSALHIASSFGHTDIAAKLIRSGANVNHANSEGITPLSMATLYGRIEVINKLLEQSADTNIQTNEGESPLHCASEKGFVNIVVQMLRRGALINKQRSSPDLHTPLSLAADNGHIEVVTKLIENHADVNTTHAHRNTALHSASLQGYLDIVTKLVSSRANINAQNTDGVTPLSMATSFGRTEVARKLIESGADVNIADSCGISALHDASEKGFLDIVVALVSHRAQVNRRTSADGYTPLYLASDYGHTKIVEKLISVGADVQIVDRRGFSALHAASSKGFLEIIMKLADCGANVNLQSSNGMTPLYMAATGQAEAASKLIQLGADVNLTDISGVSALHAAALYGVRDVVTLLVNSGAQLNMQNNDGFTPLDMATSYGSQEVAGTLIELGANIVDVNGNSALHRASDRGNLEMIERLVKNGSDVNHKNITGKTPLAMAAKSGNTEVVTKLVALRADVNISDLEGDSALHIASSNGNQYIVSILARSGALVNQQNTNGLTPLLLAVMKRHVEVVTKLIDVGAEVSVIDSSGNSVLHIASENAHLDMVVKLVSKGANTNQRRPDGYSPLCLAAATGQLGVVATLLNSGAEVNIKTKDLRSPVSIAISSDQVPTALALIRKGAILTKPETDQLVKKADDAKHKDSRQAILAAIDEIKKRTFMKVYGRLLTSLEGKVTYTSWAKLRLDLGLGLVVDAEAEANEEQLDAMMQKARVTQLEANSISGDAEAADDEPSGGSVEIGGEGAIEEKVSEQDFATQVYAEKVEFSQQAIKWWERAHDRYKEMFFSRIRSLAEGRRSYALSKRLQNSVWPIFESKLYGHRILWTPVKRDASSSILVWCVSSHDDVPRRMKLIDRAYARFMNRGIVTADASDVLQLPEDEVIINPFGNAPMKLFVSGREELSHAPLLGSDWKPPLLLCKKQVEINSQTGTVLLLGRSGTGKTKYLVSRMVSDGYVSSPGFSGGSSGIRFSQLFVSRSLGLCDFVKSLYSLEQESSRSQRVDFMTLEKFISLMEETVRVNKGPSTKAFPKAQRVDYSIFRDTLFPKIKGKDTSIDALVVWTQVRSFIKGSIEAVLLGRPLALEEYLDSGSFGSDRCRLSNDMRNKAYVIYKKYDAELRSRGMWDDADRVLDVLARCELAQLQPLSACLTDEFGGKDYDRVYVDEIQDCTQAEIALFFLAAGLRVQSLFLAGDPAQAVVEGVDFRFEEVRSIVYKLSHGRESLDRPMKLSVNYRSHQGILKCAAAVLEKMFAAFPGSAKVLQSDYGIAHGPRPAFFTASASGTDELRTILDQNEKLFVLCPDDVREGVVEASLFRRKIDVMGIRESKGLEFQDVALVDFFRWVPSSDQKVWKLMLSTADDSQLSQLNLSPQVETQLKVLYTAITRSCHRLIFIETAGSVAGQAFFAWLQAKQLAEPLVIGGKSSDASNLMTADEWRARGLDFAFSAEGASTIPRLESALSYFEKANDSALIQRTTKQLEVLRLLERLTSDASSSNSSTERFQEEDVAQLLGELLENNLVNDALSLCELVGPLSCHPTLFEEKIAGRLKKTLDVI